MSYAIEISTMHAAAVEAVGRMAPQDPQLRGRLQWHLATPYAQAYMATVSGAPVGYACGIVHGHSAWVRELHVAAGNNEQAIGSALVRALLQWMEGKGATSQLVLATPQQEARFAASGFEPDGGLLAYHGGTFIQASKDEVMDLEPEHMLAVLHLDRTATGEDREPLLREHMYLGSVYQEGTRIRGFSLPLLGHGLIVADSTEVGLELQRWLLPIQPYVHLPVGHMAAHAHLVTRKYKAIPAGTRMVRGLRLQTSPTMIFAHP